MKKGLLIITFILVAVMLVWFTQPSQALQKYRREIGITYTNDDNNSTSAIQLSWVYQDGDTLAKSTDGKTWTSISLGTPTAGEKITVAGASVPYYSVVYFQVYESGYNNDNRLNTDNATKPLFTTVTAYPPFGNAHAELSNNTQWCAGCHVTHAAEGPYLMKAPNRTALCFTCHGGAGSGSKYNVEKGTVRMKDGSYTKAPAGAFVGNPVATAVYYGPTTSTHVYSYSETPYGPMGNSNVNITWSEIDCNDCHSSHADRSSYRMLKSDPAGNSGNNVYAWLSNSDGMTAETPWYENVSNIGCLNCHDKFNTTQGSNNGNYPVFGVTHYVYRHDTNSSILSYTDRDGNTTALSTDLPLVTNASGSVKKLMCLTCHYPHGTDVTGQDLRSGQEQSAFDKDNAGGYNDYSTMLKRRPYYGVCQDCHKK